MSDQGSQTPDSAATSSRSGVVTKIISAFVNVRTTIVAGVVAVITTGIIAGLSGFLPDYGRIDIATKHVVFPGTVDVDPVIEPRWWPLHSARLVTEGFGETLQPLGDTEIVLPLVKERSVLSKILKPISFTPRTIGTTDLKLHLRSSSGRDIAYAVLQVIVQRHVDYDGAWRMRIGPYLGTAHLDVVPNTDANGDTVDVYGIFVADDRTTGLITGKFDGDRFIGQATFGDMPTRWHMNATTLREGGRVTAKGTAQLFAPTSDGWSPADTESVFDMQPVITSKS